MKTRCSAPLLIIAATGLTLLGAATAGAESGGNAETHTNSTMAATPHASAARQSREANEAATHGDRTLAPLAHITSAQARSAALAVRSGVVLEWELEREGGGSGLRYSFVIRQHGVKYEVGVDARDGRILENAAEGLNPD